MAIEQKLIAAPRTRVRTRRRPPKHKSNIVGTTYGWKSIADIKPYKNNPRKHSATQIGQITNSVLEFGIIYPVVIDEHGVIVAGHALYQALTELGYEQVPVLSADHLSPEQVQAYRIADNKLAENSEWDDGLLRIELQDLVEMELCDELSFDLGVMGFETAELDMIFAGDPQEETDPVDEIPELPDDTPCARLGDVWTLGEHRLVCGSSLEPETYVSLMKGETAAMVITDPPYNVRVQGHVRSGNTSRHREFAMASGEQSTDEFIRFLTRSVGLMSGTAAPGAVIYVFMDWRHQPELHMASEACDLEQLNLVVWNKTNAGMGSLYRSQHELVSVFRKKGRGHVNNVQLGRFGRNRTNVWTYAGVNSFGRNRDADLKDHPTVKPVAMIEDAIRDVTRRKDIVLDAFGGSGTTLLVAERCSRAARLIEIDPAYVDVTIRRWEALTGKTAIEQMTGDTFADRQNQSKTGDHHDKG